MTSTTGNFFTDQPESGLNLRDDVATILTDPLYHDLTISCADNVDITACRALLASRSSVFKRMIYGEGRVPSDRIKLDGIDSPTLRLVFRYIHTETVGADPLSPLEAVKTYHAAGLIRLPKLKELALARARWGDSVRDLAGVRSLLDNAVELFSLHDTANADLYDFLLAPFCQRVLSVGELTGLSDRALELLLTRTKSANVPFNTTEHTLLLCVVDWAWSRDETAPGEAERHARLKRLENPTEPYEELSEEMRVSVKDDRAKKSLLKMWRHIKLVLVCPHRMKLMMDAIDTLTDTSPQYEALYEHACANTTCPIGHPSKIRGKQPPPPQESPSPPRALSLQPIVEWRLGRGHVVSENGAVIENSSELDTLVGLSARISTPLTVSSEWDIVILSNGRGIDGNPANTIGLVGQEFDASNVHWYSVSYRWFFESRSRASCIYPDTAGGNCAKYGQVLKTGDVVTFHLNMTNRSCSLSINGQNCGVAWRELPDKVYPAVYLFRGAKYRYRLKSGGMDEFVLF